MCKNILETDMFICSNDKTTYKINHKFDCNEKCLVYLSTCNKGLKQYIGQTVDMFRSRWNNFKDSSRKFDRGEDCLQRHRHEHFQVPGHTGFLKGTYITLIDETDPNIPAKCEDYWIHTLNTKPRMGLYGEGGYWALFWYSFCTIFSFPGFGRLVLRLSSDFRIIITYFISLL